jgi:hypothetical protein
MKSQSHDNISFEMLIQMIHNNLTFNITCRPFVILVQTFHNSLAISKHNNRSFVIHKQTLHNSLAFSITQQ